MATGMWLISYGLLVIGNRLASFSATLIGLLNLPLTRLLSIFCCKPVYIPSRNGAFKWKFS